ncbi:MAG: DUF3089 domain-containing protein [Negativicutes bacterium]|nr:DUF3089 domain-containing protein [Negativicutes bacterium]
MNVKLVLTLAIVLCFGFTLVAQASDQQATDYSKPEHWLVLPTAIDKKVDIFYLYPTAWKKASDTSPNICEIDDPTMLIGAKAAYGRQATAFETVGNMYAPYYRQADLSPVDREKVIAGIPTHDAVAAFEYYIKHYNNGRPFILAGHSQGSNVLSNLLAGYMNKHPEVRERMVAAYVIGYSVTGEYLKNNPHLKFAKGPDDTGVIISYNTESPNVVVGTNPVLLPGGIAINPITWTRDETLAPASKNLGSLMPVNGVLTPAMNYADARVDKSKGVVICSTADADKLHQLTSTFVTGVFHSFDYLFYYYDLRENAANRVEQFFNKRENPTHP